MDLMDALVLASIPNLPDIILSLMLRDVPLVRLYERWEMYERRIPEYAERGKRGIHISGNGSIYARGWTFEGKIPTECDGSNWLFDHAMVELRSRIALYLDERVRVLHEEDALAKA